MLQRTLTQNSFNITFKVTVLILFVKLVVKLQEAAVIPPQTLYQAPKRTKMSREAQSSPVSKG